MFLYVWILIAADGIVALTAIHAGGRPHQPCVKQLHRCKIHIAQGGHNVRKSEPLGKFRRGTGGKFIIDRLVFILRPIFLTGLFLVLAANMIPPIYSGISLY